MGRFAQRFVSMGLVLVLCLLGVAVSPAGAAGSEQEVIDALDRDGRYLERTEAGLDSVIDQANGDGVAFAWIDTGGDEQLAESLADTYVAALEDLESPYHTVLVLTTEAFAARSLIYSDEEIDAGLNASFANFSSNEVADGVRTFATVTTAGLVPQAEDTTATTVGTGATDQPDDSGGGIGFGTVLLGALVAGGGFLLFRAWRGRRRQQDQDALDLEEDRIEIEEQLKNNADRVIQLGDRVIASGDGELIALYEEASQTYQDVSQGVDEADTAAQIDELDDRIDRAEWQFEVIEARLDGRPVPPMPVDRDDADPDGDGKAGTPPPPSGAQPPRPEGGDRSVVTSPTTGRSYPRPAPSGRSGGVATGGRSSRRGGFGGGGLGGVLGGILGNIVLGGGLGGRSRRTQRRSGTGFGFPSSTNRRRSADVGGRRSGGLGGGVLRRGGSGRTRSRSNTRARTRSTNRRRSSRSGGGRRLGKGGSGSRRL